MSATPDSNDGDTNPESVSSTRGHERYIERARGRDEPTRTRTARKTYARRLRGRWKAIRAAIRESIIEKDALSLRTEALVDAPDRYAFTSEADKVPAFDNWLTSTTEREILQQFGKENEWVTGAYERGVDDARTEMRALGLTSEATAGATAAQLPIHKEQLSKLYTRNFGALKGMNEATANQMRRVLSEGLASGRGPRDLAEDLADRVDAVGITRANTIARTEVMYSHNRARATEWDRAGIQKVDILLAGDACELCVALKAGEPYSIEEAPGLLPQHPNCRCSIAIHTESSNE